MMTTASQFRVMNVVVAAALIHCAAATAETFEPTPTFVVENRSALGVVPKDVVLGNGVAYVLGTDANGTSGIEMRDATSLELLETLSVPATIEDIVADRKSGNVYAIGHVDGVTRFQVMTAKLQPRGGITIKPRLGHPTLTTTPDGFVAVSGIRTDFADGFFAAIDVSSGEPELREDFFSLDARRGVMNGWLDAEIGAIFLNASWDARLAAVATGKSYVMSEFGVQAASGLSEPYAVHGVLDREPCRFGQPSSFLVADMTRNVLSVVDYDDAFQSLDMLSVVEFNLADTGASRGRLEGTSMREPNGIISASCEQSVVLLGSRTSNEVAQFARNLDLATLERVGTIRLPAAPTAIAVDEDAGFAIAVSADNRAIIRLSNETSEAPATRVIGDSDVRELQRTLTEIGIPVGSIDGIIGTKTERAIGIAERKFGVEINPQRDIKKSIETLKGVFK